jgi:hypothetical protein
MAWVRAVIDEMSRVVFVHGVGKQVLGPESLLVRCGPALRDGVHLAGGPCPGHEDVTCAFYGHLFRRRGVRGGGWPELTAADIEDPIEVDLLVAWWKAAAEADAAVPSPEGRTRVRTPLLVQRALDALSHSAFFAGLADAGLLFSLRQVRRYLTEADLRKRAHEIVAAEIDQETRVVVAHSLGSVVAYEALCALGAGPGAGGIVLVTLGSPLGIRNVIFDRLVPQPINGCGVWPAPVRRWVNIADRGDIVALVKSLSTRFGDGVEDIVVHNGARAHDVVPYLTAEETGRVIATALALPSGS